CLVFILTVGGLFAQSATGFQYVFPLFNSQPRSEVVLGNLSNAAVNAEVALLDSNTDRLADTVVIIAARSQQRLTAASFGLSSFTGTVLIKTPAPISAVATIGDGSGSFESVAPAAGSDEVIVPFGPASQGNMAVTIFNPAASTTSVLISAVAPDGTI